MYIKSTSRSFFYHVVYFEMSISQLLIKFLATQCSLAQLGGVGAVLDGVRPGRHLRSDHDRHHRRRVRRQRPLLRGDALPHHSDCEYFIIGDFGII